MKKRAVLIIHGFGGNEEEILYLHKHLEAENVASFWIRLTGHDGDKKSFSKATYQHWIADVERKLAELEQEYEAITCIGFSMGGLLTIQVADRQSVDQLILCNTPIYLYNLNVITKDVVAGVVYKKEELLEYYFDSATETSINACLEFLSLLYRTKKKLKKKIQWKNKKKILVLQNRTDETTYYKSAYYLAKHSNAQVTLKLYEGGRHQLFLGENKELVVADIETFILS